MSRVVIVNIRAIGQPMRIKVRAMFKSYIAKNSGLSPDVMDSARGEFFAVMDRGRVAAGIWVLTHPGRPNVGDVHVVASRRRILDYDTRIAFDLFLMERARIMNLTRWEASVLTDKSYSYVISALRSLNFKPIPSSEIEVPGVGEIGMMYKEVI